MCVTHVRVRTHSHSTVGVEYLNPMCGLHQSVCENNALTHTPRSVRMAPRRTTREIRKNWFRIRAKYNNPLSRQIFLSNFDSRPLGVGTEILPERTIPAIVYVLSELQNSSLVEWARQNKTAEPVRNLLRIKWPSTRNTILGVEVGNWICLLASNTQRKTVDANLRELCTLCQILEECRLDVAFPLSVDVQMTVCYACGVRSRSEAIKDAYSWLLLGAGCLASMSPEWGKIARYKLPNAGGTHTESPIDLQMLNWAYPIMLALYPRTGRTTMLIAYLCYRLLFRLSSEAYQEDHPTTLRDFNLEREVLTIKYRCDRKNKRDEIFEAGCTCDKVPQICAVHIVMELIDQYGENAAFHAIQPAETVRKRIVHLMSLKYPGVYFGLHSLRKGAATDLRRAGATDSVIIADGGWSVARSFEGVYVNMRESIETFFKKIYSS